MLKNYIKTAVRNFYRNKLYVGVGVIGLTIGLAVCLLALQLFMYEFSYDNIPNKAGLYEVVLHLSNTSATNLVTTSSTWASTPPGLSGELESNFPEIESSTSFETLARPVTTGPDPAISANICWADSNFLRVFNYSLLSGDANSCLNSPYYVVLTKEFAERRFGTLNVVGRTIKIETYSQREFLVTGVLGNVPGQSSFPFDVLMGNAGYDWIYAHGDFNWQRQAPFCFVRLNKHAKPGELARKFPAFVRTTGGGSNTALALVPFAGIHFRTDILGIPSTYQIKYLYAFGSIALMVLMVSVFNFVSLSLVMSSRRLKEIGVRKVAGAGHGSLFAQFLSENVLLSSISAVISLTLVELLLPTLSKLLGTSLSLNSQGQGPAVLIWLFTVVGISALVTAYSSRLLIRQVPDLLIKGRISKFSIKEATRRTLTGLQFAATGILLCCTLVAVSQMYYVGHKDLGFDPSNVIVIGRHDLNGGTRILESELRQYPNVISVTESDWLPTKSFSASVGTAGWSTQYADVDENIIPTLGFKLLKGRNFDPKLKSDSGAVILNEKAVKVLGVQDPIGQGINLTGTPIKVVGIVKDFNYSSLAEPVGPVILNYVKSDFPALGIKIRKGGTRQTLQYLEQLWRKHNPGVKLDYSFLQDDIRKLYSEQEATIAGLLAGSTLAFLISLLGIYALSSLLVEARTKEIAVRRTLGGSTAQIVRLISLPFVKVVGFSTVVAWPLAYLIVGQWLRQFAYHVQINLWLFALAAVVELAAAMTIVVVHATRAASENPVATLRYE